MKIFNFYLGEKIRHSFIFSFLFLFLISSVSAALCYQESANTSNQAGTDGPCSLSYDGKYAITGSYSGTQKNAYDGNWSTSTSQGAATTNYIYINYTKPVGLLGALWATKQSSTTNANITIPSSCLSYDISKLSLVIETVRTTSNGGNYSCINGSGLIRLTGSTSTYQFNEDAIYWNISDAVNAPNVTNLQNPVNVNYNPSTTYQFNATILTDSVIDKAILIFNGTNYSASNVGSLYNTSVGTLKAGVYNWSWWVNTTVGGVNDSEHGTLTVNKNITQLSITASPGWSSSFGVQTTITGTGCPSGISCNFTRDGVQVSNPDIQTLAINSYLYNYSSIGNENYTILEYSNNLNIVYPSASSGGFDGIGFGYDSKKLPKLTRATASGSGTSTTVYNNNNITNQYITYNGTSYNSTYQSYFDTYSKFWTNHSQWIIDTYGKWFYNQTYTGGTYNSTYDAKISYNATWNQSLADGLYLSNRTNVNVGNNNFTINGTSLKVNTNTGIVTMGRQSGARAYGAILSVPSGVWTVVNFTSENWDVQGEMDTSTNKGRFTAKEAGYYEVKEQLWWDTTITASCFGGIRVNGADVAYSVCNNNDGSTTAFSSDIVQLAAGGYVEGIVYQISGSGKTLNNVTQNTYMSIQKIA